VARRDREPSGSSASRADWLGRGQAGRRRPWALEEQLLGPRVSDSQGLVCALTGRLSEERFALCQIEAELAEQTRTVSELERQLEAALRTSDSDEPPPAASTREHRASRTVLTLRSTSPPPDRDYWLSRCEDFLVESPTGRGIGVVEGLRFGLRIDRPDLLEVAVGRLRRRVLLVAVDEVEYISGEEERVVLNHDPLTRRDLAHELLARARGKLRVSPS
jgi:hypothetical protein